MLTTLIIIGLVVFLGILYYILRRLNRKTKIPNGLEIESLKLNCYEKTIQESYKESLGGKK